MTSKDRKDAVPDFWDFSPGVSKRIPDAVPLVPLKSVSPRQFPRDRARMETNGCILLGLRWPESEFPIILWEGCGGINR
jgi:hypothetical protein